jgi:GNAT superfamily N-acetyltransferase
VPLVQGTSLGPLTAAEKKRRREKAEEGQRIARRAIREATKVAKDAEGRAQGVGNAYFNKTGKLPSPEKTVEFVKSTAGLKLDNQADYDDILPDWVKDIEPDPEDLSPTQIVPRKHVSLKKVIEKKNVGVSSPWDPEGVGLHQVKTGRPELELYDEAYGELDRVTRTKMEPYSAARWFYKEQADKFKDAEKAGLQPGRVMDLSRLMPLRDRTLGVKTKNIKDRDDQEAVWDIVTMLDRIYPDEGIAEKYGNDLREVKWDDTLDYYVSRYILEGNLAHVLIHDATPEHLRSEKMVKRRDAAKALIDDVIDGVEVGDDMYAMLQSLGVTGDSSQPIQVSDQYAEYLYYGFSNARKPYWTDQQLIWQYADMFGKDFLPPAQRQFYEEVMDEQWNPTIAKYEELVGMPLSKIDMNRKGSATFLYAMASELAGLGTPSEEELETLSGIIETPWEAGLTEGVSRPVRGVVTPGNRFEAGGGTRTETVTKFTADLDEILKDIEEGDGPPANVNMSEALHVIIPKVLELDERVTEKYGVFDRFERGFNRVMLVGSALQDMDREEARRLGITVEEQAQGKGDSRSVLSMLPEAWERAGEMAYETDEMHTFMIDQWEEYGWNREEHATLFAISAYGTSIGKDILLDMATTGGAKTVLGAATKAVRLATNASHLEQVASATTEVARLEAAIAKVAGRGIGGVAPKSVEAAKMAALRTELAYARNELAYLNRPLWHDTVAMALAKKKQNPIAVYEVLNMKTTGEIAVEKSLGYFQQGGKFVKGVGYEEGTRFGAKYVGKRAEQMHIIEQIAESTDEEFIARQLSKLVTEHGQRIDMGNVYWRRARQLNKAGMGGYIPPQMKYAFSRTGTFNPLTDDLLLHTEKFWKLTHGGLPHTAAGKRAANVSMEQIREKAWRLMRDARTPEEYAYHAQRLQQKMEGLVKTALQARKLEGGMRKSANKFARMNGLKDDLDTYWDLYNLQTFLASGKSTRGKVLNRLKRTRMYDPRIALDDAGKALVKERSLVHVRKAELTAATRTVRAAKTALKDQRAMMMRGHGTKQGVQEAKRLLKDAQTHLKSLKETKGLIKEEGHAVPFLEAQLAKHVQVTIDPLRVSAANSGRWRNVIEARQGTGLLFGMGPTVNGAIGLFRFVALARIGFMFTALGIDEFWRPQNLRGLVGRVLEPDRTRRAKAILEERGFFREQEAAEITGLMKNFDTWTSYTTNHPDYNLLLNAEIQQLQHPNETGMLVWKEVGKREPGETMLEYTTRWKNKMRERILRDDEDGNRLRLHLIQMRRMNEGTWLPDGEIKAMAEEKQHALAQANSMVDDFNEQYVEAVARRRQLASELGQPGRPSDEFTAAWMQERFEPVAAAVPERPPAAAAEAAPAAREWPLSDKPAAPFLADNPDVRRVWMTPDEYLEIEARSAAGRTHAKELREQGFFSEDNIEKLRKRIRDGDEISSPWLEYDVRAGEWTSQEGRQRALAAIDEGVELIPVDVATRKGSWTPELEEELLGRFARRGDEVAESAPAAADEVAEFSDDMLGVGDEIEFKYDDGAGSLLTGRGVVKSVDDGPLTEFRVEMPDGSIRRVNYTDTRVWGVGNESRLKVPRRRVGGGPAPAPAETVNPLTSFGDVRHIKQGGRKASSVKTKLGDTDVHITVMDDEPSVAYINDIRVEQGMRGEGRGTQALDDIVAWADDNGMELRVRPLAEPDDVKAGSMTTDQLTEWYSKRGFTERVTEGRDTFLVRKAPDETTGAKGRWVLPDDDDIMDPALRAHPRESTLDITMTPEEYLDESSQPGRLAAADDPDLYIDENYAAAKGTQEGQLSAIRQRFANGEPVDPATLEAYIDEDGVARIAKDSIQEGDHRALAAAEMDMDEIPVRVIVWVRGRPRRPATAEEMKGVRFERVGGKADEAAEQADTGPRMTDDEEMDALLGGAAPEKEVKPSTTPEEQTEKLRTKRQEVYDDLESSEQTAQAGAVGRMGREYDAGTMDPETEYELVLYLRGTGPGTEHPIAIKFPKGTAKEERANYPSGIFRAGYRASEHRKTPGKTPDAVASYLSGLHNGEGFMGKSDWTENEVLDLLRDIKHRGAHRQPRVAAKQAMTEGERLSAQLDMMDRLLYKMGSGQRLDKDEAKMLKALIDEDYIKPQKSDKLLEGGELGDDLPDWVTAPEGMPLANVKGIVRKYRDRLTRQERQSLYYAWTKHKASQVEGGLEKFKALEEARAHEGVVASQLRKAKTNVKMAEGLTRDDFGSQGWTQAIDDWMDEWLEKLGVFAQDDELMDAYIHGKKLTKAQVKAIEQRIKASGGEMPVVVGSSTTSDWGVNLPIIGPLAEKAGIGPFWWLEQSSEFIRRGTVMHYFGAEYDRLIKLGFDQERAVGRAYSYAMDVAETASYSHTMTGFEYATRNVFLFQPAYRQAMAYWGKLAARHPALAAGISQKFRNDYPALQLGPISVFMPLPFFLQENFEQFAIPGFSPFIVLPFKGANMATGWSETEPGKWEYTGATELDDIYNKIPGMTFASKNTSATFQLDDILWGFFPDLITPNAQSSRLMTIVHSMTIMSLFKDPVKRERLASNIARAQLSKGMRPDFDVAMEEMRQDDLLWRIASMGGAVRNPEAIIGMASRMFNPFGRVSYMPEELEDNMEGKPFYQKFWGTERVRTMTDFYFELTECYGDKEKMAELYDRFPKAKAIKEFYDMDYEEKVHWISKPENLWAVPYVNGRNDYKNGRPLIGGEYWLKLQNDYVINKPLYGPGGYLEGVKKYWANLGWSKTREKIEKDADAGMRSAESIAEKAIRQYAKTDAQRKQWQMDWESYRDGWSDPNAGGDYEDGGRSAPFWLTNYVNAHGIKDPMKWNVEAINNRMYRAFRSEGYFFTDDGISAIERGKSADGITPYDEGLKDWYLNDVWRATGDYKDRTGAIHRVTDALKKYASPQYRRLFDWEESVSEPAIREAMEKRESYQKRILKDLMTNEHWKLINPGEQLASIGMDVDVSAVNKLYMKLDNLYNTYQEKQKPFKQMSSEWVEVRQWYIKERNKLYKQNGGELWRDGIGGRILHSELAADVPQSYLNAVVKAMDRDNPDYQRIVETFKERAIDPTDFFASNQKKLRRAAWASVAAAGAEYRKQMLDSWNESMGSKGISPASNASEPYRRRLQALVEMWKNLSPKFAEEWGYYMGDTEGGVYNLLDANR